MCAVWCSHPMADVLSPIASMQAWSESGSVHETHTLITIPMNSSRLFTPFCPWIGLSGGILTLHARPFRL